MSANKPDAPLHGHVPDGWHTRSEVAKLIGRSPQTIKRWHNSGTYVASSYMQYGQVEVWLYSDEDVEKMKDLASKLHAGRPPKVQKEDVTG